MKAAGRYGRAHVCVYVVASRVDARRDRRITYIFSALRDKGNLPCHNIFRKKPTALRHRIVFCDFILPDYIYF